MKTKTLIKLTRRRLRLLARELVVGRKLPKKRNGRLDWTRISKERSKAVKVVYVVGMPRTGTTLMKNYFGDNLHFVLHPFSWNYYDAWLRAKLEHENRIIIDKCTQNMLKIEEIWMNFGTECVLAGIVRDPRDQLISLLEFPGHQYIPRDRTFWNEWTARYGEFLALCLRYFAYERNYLVRYEDLVRFPGQAKRDFLNWMGLGHDDASLGSAYSTANTAYAQIMEERNIDPDSLDAWQLAREVGLHEDFKFHAHTAVFDSSVGRWKRITDPITKKLIESCQDHPQALRLMRLLGYDAQGTGPIKEHIVGCHVFAPHEHNDKP